MDSPRQTTPRLRAIFEQILDAPPELRSLLVDELCGSDSALRIEVEALLRTGDNLGEFLERPIASLVPLLQTAVRRESPGELIGPYLLGERLGEGSFSTVWSAQQTRPIRREVALKILKPGLDVVSIVERFEQERDALARLEHSNICRVYDAGIHASGRPYFVMERVNGVPITSFASGKRIDFREIAMLMIPVAAAVEHAHRQGLIHRDLKPANVLVGVVDDLPVPKVIDFGIAKVITPDRDTTQTLAAIPSGSPAYMSPEQLAMHHAIDERADVYAMGVILFELLTSARPDRDRESSALARTLRGKGVPDPLARIVLQAMNPDRNQRYPSAKRFADDLQRFADGRPPKAGRIARSGTRRLIIVSLIAFAAVMTAYMAWRPSRPVAVTPANARWPAATDAEQLWELRIPGNGGWWSLEVDRESRRIHAATVAGDLVVIHLDSGEVVQSLRPDGRIVIRAEMSADRHLLAVATRDPDHSGQRVLLMDRESMKVIGTVPIDGAIHAMEFVDRAGSIIAASVLLDGKPYVDFYDCDSRQRIARGPTWPTGHIASYVVPTGDDRTVIVSDPDGQLIQIDSKTGKSESIGSESARLASFSLLDNAQLAITGGFGATVIDLKTGTLQGKYTTPQRTTNATLSQDGKTVIVSSLDHRITGFDRLTGIPRWTVDTKGDMSMVETHHVVHEEGLVLIASTDGLLRLVRIR